MTEYPLNAPTADRLRALHAEAQRHQARFDEAALLVRVALGVPEGRITLDLDAAAPRFCVEAPTAPPEEAAPCSTPTA